MEGGLTRNIQRVIIRNRWNKTFCIPNHHAHKWWECDVFELTRAGYFVEYEIKVSLSDFRADARKLRESYKWNPLLQTTERAYSKTKHQQLAERQTNGPSRFYFVTPPGLVPVELIPEWAGLIEVDGNERMVRRAVQLHSVKASDELVRKANQSCYFRFHHNTGACCDPEFEDGEGI